MLQIGFYLHMMYATTYIETVRKDYLVQMIHHVITLALLTYSYSLRLVVNLLYIIIIISIGFIKWDCLCCLFMILLIYYWN